ncbi:hypothetical protein L3X37_08925 [Sabulilitoribacter arenilitoris]|uniref:Uncharacterized protein n=1 Tax=Wocania arenilitoris TaxID=2044858 RepID=A0AAE3ER07_9FLAO|nr:hypothetical protein [Wocania arenilitoris]MCF7568485.1 hypothetical protein [Wocania arenilitoris]
METNCYLCHSPSVNHGNRIAPPMIAIKKHYIDDATQKNNLLNRYKLGLKKTK